MPASILRHSCKLKGTPSPPYHSHTHKNMRNNAKNERSNSAIDLHWVEGTICSTTFCKVLDSQVAKLSISFLAFKTIGGTPPGHTLSALPSLDQTRPESNASLHLTPNKEPLTLQNLWRQHWKVQHPSSRASDISVPPACPFIWLWVPHCSQHTSQCVSQVELPSSPRHWPVSL